jgi:hypothetical protein
MIKAKQVNFNARTIVELRSGCSSALAIPAFFSSMPSKLAYRLT